jgi:hypothetical protein
MHQQKTVSHYLFEYLAYRKEKTDASKTWTEKKQLEMDPIRLKKITKELLKYINRTGKLNHTSENR